MAKRTRRKQKITLPPIERQAVIDNRIPSLLHNAVVSTIKVDNPEPEQPGDKIIAYRTLRRDPLAWMHDREQIDEAQYQAGRAWQRDWGLCEQGARAIDPTKEAVDGGSVFDPLSDRRMRASERLAKAAAAFGEEDGASDDRRILHAFLALGMGIEQIGLAYFGRYGAGYARRLGIRVRGILDKLAIAYGFAMPKGRVA